MRDLKMTFDEWVRKWQIGPGMNDRPPYRECSSKFIARVAAAPAESPLGHFLGEDCRRSLSLSDEGLYTGFDGTVGDGWVPILDRLAHDLVEMGWDRDLHQTKEKFGTLRFYIGAETEEMSDRIRVAEEESARTCEVCGAPGSLRTIGWHKTLCDACDDSRLKDRGY
jgi:hypothetical protein